MDTTQEHKCIFCKECFENKEDLQIHFRKHGDPKFNQDVKSNKTQNEGQVQGSADSQNDSRSEMVSCDVCTEVFPTISKAITHKHKMHPDHDAKYFCPWCGKLFTMKHLYNKHIENNHDGKDQSEGTGFHCDNCEVDFFAPAAMVYHNKFFHRQDTELAAIGQSKKMKLFSQELLPIYYCPFCGEEYNNKVNLHKHMGDDHIDENQSPDDVLRCPLCEAIFYHLDAYELHLTFHSSGDLYSEENEIARDLTEFSLETVPPIMEKVENEVDVAADSIGIEELLQQAMNESNDNDNSNSEGIPGKKKKRKKHKKKKTITLDEFLNMNKDVFGEGLGDVQGIEEVPTQAVAKQLKPRKPKIAPGVKISQSVEIEKLKKQGIMVKKKPQTSKFQGLKVMQNKPALSQNIKVMKDNLIVQKTKPPLSSPNDVLAKLQNTQIKITKRNASVSQESETSKEEISKDCNSDESVKDALNKNNLEDKLNVNTTNKEEELIEENVTNEENLNKDQKQEISHNTPDLKRSYPSPENEHPKLSLHDSNQGEKDGEFQITNNTVPCDKIVNADESSNKGVSDQDMAKSSTDTTNILKNLSQHITIKSKSSPNQTLNQINKNQCSEVNQLSDVEKDSEDEIVSAETKTTVSNESNTNKISVNDALKHLSHLTVKSVNQEQTVKTASLDFAKENTSEPDDESDFEKCISSSTIPKHIDTNKPTSDDIQQESPKSLDALKSLKHVTVKSMKPQQAKELVDKDYNESDYDDHSSVNVQQETSKSLNILKNRQVTVMSNTSQNYKILDEKDDDESDYDNYSSVQQDSTKPFNAMKKLSKQLTIKSSIPQQYAKTVKDDENDDDNHNKGHNQKDSPKTLNALKNLSKPVPVESTRPQQHAKIVDEQDYESDMSDRNDHIPQESPKSLDALKNLGKHVTVKSTKPQQHAKNFDEEDDNSNDDIHGNDHTQPESSKNVNVLKNLSKHVTVKSMKPQQAAKANDEDDCASDNDDNYSNIDVPQEPSKSLNALKNLSKHVTVKPVKTQEPFRKFAEEDELEKDKQSDIGIEQESPKSLKLLINLSKHIQVKSTGPLTAKVAQRNKNESDNDEVNNDTDSESNANNGESTLNKSQNIRLPSQVTMKSLRSPAMKTSSPAISPKSGNTVHEDPNNSANILKRLSNITAKPLNTIKTKQAQTVVNTSKQVTGYNKQHFSKKTVTTKATEEVEIFNVDDSDDEDVNNQIESKTEITKSSSFNKFTQNCSNKQIDALRNLNKNITIKSSSQHKTANFENFTSDHHDDDSDDESVQVPDKATTSVTRKLQNLENITVKSSPRKSVNSGCTEKNNMKPKSAKNVTSKVAITELDGEHASDEEFENTSPVIQTPDSESDHEKGADDDSDNEEHLEYPVKNNMPKMTDTKTNVKTNSKKVPATSLKDMNFDDEEDDFDESEINHCDFQENTNIPKFGNAVSVKSLKQSKPDSEVKTNAQFNRNIKQQLAAQSVNQSTNQKIAKSADQVNTVNKEVTVQRFQSKTVIQEITTTVTKTIRTVNQTVQQDVCNVSQNNSMIRPQRIQGATNQPKNLQGTIVRQAAPVRPKIRNSAPVNRAVVGSVVKTPTQGTPVRGSAPPSNQLVPFRPSTTNQVVPIRPGVTIRNQNPRMPTIRKPGPSTANQHQPVYGKPLKISPNAVLSNKRPQSEETSGPFSCFKKPKSSPIPTFEDNEEPIQYASTSQQMSRSNFSSTTKTVKGNSVVTSSQTSQEMSASMKQVSKVSGMSGMKMVKTCQAKTTHVEEKSEISPSKRTALEAIERLQRQGLLVKKPRVEEESEQDQFNSEDDDNDDGFDDT